MATGPSGHLGQELIGPLSGAKIAPSQAQVTVHHTDQRQSWKVVSLRRRLGRHHDVEFAPGHRLDHRPRGVGVGDGVGREQNQSGFGKPQSRLLLDSLDPGAD